MSIQAKASVLLTGISGNLGRTIARKLHRQDSVIGIDRRPFSDRPKDIEHHQIDLRRKKTGDIFRSRNIKAVVHIGISFDPRLPETERNAVNVLGTRQLLEHCVRYGVKKVICLSSATVYGPDPDNPNFIGEDAPLQATIRHGEIRDLVEVDMHVQSFFWRYPEIETVILRPVHIVGPSIRNTASRYLRMKRPWILTGFDPLVQLIHQEDVADAVVAALMPGIKGIYNVTGPGEAPLSKILHLLGRKPRSIPHFVAGHFLDRLWKLNLSPFPPQEIEQLRFLCVIDGQRIQKELGYQPKYGLRETVMSVDSSFSNVRAS